MSRAPLPNHVPKLPTGLSTILWILLVFQPAVCMVALILITIDGVWGLFPCLLGFGTALYILIAQYISHKGYNYYVVLVLSAANFLANKLPVGEYMAMGNFCMSQNKCDVAAVVYALGGLYAAQGLLWLTYLIILAIAVAKHRKTGGHSKWIPGEQNPRHDDMIPDPLHSTDLPLGREPPPGGDQSNTYQLGSVRLDNPLRLNSFGDPTDEERCAVGGEPLDSHRNTPGNGSPVRQQEGVCAVGGEETGAAREAQGGERVKIVITEERAECC